MENVRASSVGVATTLTGLLSVSPSSMPQSTDIVGKERARTGVAGRGQAGGTRGTVDQLLHFYDTARCGSLQYNVYLDRPRSS